MERRTPSSEWGTRRSMRRSRLRWIRRSSTERCASLGSIHRSCMSVLQAVTANHVTFHAALSSASPLDPFGKGCARQMDKAVNIMSDWMNAPDSIPTSILSEVRQPLSPRSSLGPLDWVQKYRQKKGGAGNRFYAVQAHALCFLTVARAGFIFTGKLGTGLIVARKERTAVCRRTRTAWCASHFAWCMLPGAGGWAMDGPMRRGVHRHRLGRAVRRRGH